MALSFFTAGADGVGIDGVVIIEGTIDVNGTADAIILDQDGDTTISAPSDDQIDIEIAGADDFTITANSFNVLTGSMIAGPSSSTVPFHLGVAQQALSGAGAANVTAYYTAWTTTAADALTLADGVVEGQLKKIQLIVDGGTGTLTPTNLQGGTTITFADAGDFAILMWESAGWIALELGNAADGATAPVLA